MLYRAVINDTMLSSYVATGLPREYSVGMIGFWFIAETSERLSQGTHRRQPEKGAFQRLDTELHNAPSKCAVTVSCRLTSIARPIIMCVDLMRRLCNDTGRKHQCPVRLS